MKKIPSLYVRDINDMAHVLPEVNPVASWVIDDAARVQATVKYDGTCMLLDSYGMWWSRRQVRPDRAVPENYVPVEHDPATGKTRGWIPAEQSQYRDFHAEALELHGYQRPGTFELVGPRIGKNPHRLSRHRLLSHGCTPMEGIPTDFHALAEYLHIHQWTWGGYLEGVVWHHEDGRMAKIKTKDFSAQTFL